MEWVCINCVGFRRCGMWMYLYCSQIIFFTSRGLDIGDGMSTCDVCFHATCLHRFLFRCSCFASRIVVFKHLYWSTKSSSAPCHLVICLEMDTLWHVVGHRRCYLHVVYDGRLSCTRSRNTTAHRRGWWNPTYALPIVRSRKCRLRLSVHDAALIPHGLLQQWGYHNA